MKFRLTRGGIPHTEQTAEAWREWAKNPRATIRCSQAAWEELKAALGGDPRTPNPRLAGAPPLALAFAGIPIFLDESVPWLDVDLPNHRDEWMVIGYDPGVSL
jgi:hypothetical protein